MLCHGIGWVRLSNTDAKTKGTTHNVKVVLEVNHKVLDFALVDEGQAVAKTGLGHADQKRAARLVAQQVLRILGKRKKGNARRML